MALGKCLLTGANGTFVKSHLTPQAFTEPEESGDFFMNAGNRTRPTRTFTSWYDKAIVTRKGEDILSELDNYAVTTLRKHKLVWSGWGKEEVLESALHEMFSPTHGIRKVVFEDVQRVRLFFLSLLWRWSVSKRTEAAEVKLSKDHQDQLRNLILAGDAGSPAFFPIQLVQLSTKGETHNMGPILTTKVVPALDEGPSEEVQFYRFYFDGLAIHFGMPAYSVGVGDMVLGVEEHHTFPTIAYEASFQMKNLDYVKRDALYEYPHDVLRIIKASIGNQKIGGESRGIHNLMCGDADPI
jgi:hypothetical protein